MNVLEATRQIGPLPGAFLAFDHLACSAPNRLSVGAPSAKQFDFRERKRAALLVCLFVGFVGSVAFRHASD